MKLVQPFHHVLPVHEDLFNGGLYATHAGWEKVVPGESYPKQEHHPHFYWFSWDEGRILPEFCLAHVLEGSGESETLTGRRVLAKGDTYFVSPGVWHRHRPSPATGWSLLWVHFNGGLPSQWQEQGAFGENPQYPRIAMPELFAEELERLLLKVHAAPTQNSIHISWQVIGLLSHFLVEEAERPSSQRMLTGDSVVDHAIEHIWNYSHGLLDVPGVVSAVGISRRSLERRFKALLGHGLLDEIQQCRFTRAAWLLVETELPVKTIVGRAGFGSHEQMRLVFQKRTGVSPEQYRQGGRAGASDRSLHLPQGRGAAAGT